MQNVTRRTFFTLAAGAIIAAATPATAEAMPKKFRNDPRVTQNGVTYLLHDRAAIVTRTPDRRSVTIPDRIRHAGMSYAVTAIWDGTFSRTPKTARVMLKCRHLETIEDAAIWERRSMLVVTYDESVYKWLRSTGARARIRYRAAI